MNLSVNIVHFGNSLFHLQELKKQFVDYFYPINAHHQIMK